MDEDERTEDNFPAQRFENAFQIMLSFQQTISHITGNGGDSAKSPWHNNDNEKT